MSIHETPPPGSRLMPVVTRARGNRVSLMRGRDPAPRAPKPVVGATGERGRGMLPPPKVG